MAPETSSRSATDLVDDPWNIFSDDAAGWRGSGFIRMHAEAFLLETWMGNNWHRTAYDFKVNPASCFPGIKALTQCVAPAFIRHLTEFDWAGLAETWEEALRRGNGILEPGTTQPNPRVNLARELEDRFGRFIDCPSEEDVTVYGIGFRLGVLQSLRSTLAAPGLAVANGRSVEAVVKAQALFELWHECHGRLSFPFQSEGRKIPAVGVLVGLIHVLAELIPGLPVPKHLGDQDEFNAWMLKTVMPAYHARYAELTGQPRDSGKRLALLAERLEWSRITSLIKGKGRQPRTKQQELEESFLGLPIQVINSPEGDYMFLGPGLVTPLLGGLTIWDFEQTPVKLLQIRHGEDASIAVLLPTVAAFNVGLGGWLVCPNYWSGRGSIGPSRQLHLERLLKSLPGNFEVDSIDASYKDFKAFLQSRNDIGTPTWLKPESLREQALELERQRIQPSAQSLILEFLADRYARSIGCDRIEAGVQANGVEFDVIGHDGVSVHHFECENNAIGSRSAETLRELQAKARHLEEVNNKPVRQYYVTRRVAIQSSHGEKLRRALRQANITILTYEDDLAKLIPKGSARNRLNSIFPGTDDDPVASLQALLEEFDHSMEGE